MVVRPGTAVNPNRIRWDATYVVFAGAFMFTQLYQLAFLARKDGADPLAIVIARLGRRLSESAWLVVPLAAGIGLLLYRALARCFTQMEPPLRANKMDAWFIEI